MAPHGKKLSLNLKETTISLHQDKQGYKKIAKTLKPSKNTVAEVVQRYEKNGTLQVVKKRLGRPRTLTKRSMRYIAGLVGQNRRQSAAQLANAISETTGSSVSVATIRRTLHDGNLDGRRPRRKPFLKPKHKQGRLQFANDHRDKPMSFWDSVL